MVMDGILTRAWGNDSNRRVVVGLVATATALTIGGALWYARQRRLAVKRQKKSNDAVAPPLPSEEAVPSGSVRTGTTHGPSVVANSALCEAVVSPERTQAIQLYHALKADANTAFQRSEWDTALRGYQDAVDVLSALPGIDAEVLHLSQVVRANVVLVFLKVGRYDEARMLATFLLQDDAPMPKPLMCKVLFRRASAMVHLGDLDGAIGDLEAAQHFSPSPDAAIDEELAKLRKRRGQGA